MEELQAQCVNVTRPIEVLAAILNAKEASGETEKDCGDYSTLYRLDNRHLFVRMSLLRYRRILADATTIACDNDSCLPFSANPLIRPTLVASVKHGHSGVAPFGARVALDIDTETSLIEGSAFPTGEQLFEAACAFFSSNTEPSDIDFAKEDALVFMGSFNDTNKRVSAHIYFTRLSFTRDGANQMTKTDPLKKEFDALLAPYGVSWDCQVSNQGLKYPFMDKWDPKANSYRGMSQVLVYQHGSLANSILTWHDIFSLADPLVHESDDAWDRTIRFKRIAAAPKRQAVGTGNVPSRVLSVGTGDVRSKLLQAVPEWAQGELLRKRHGASTLDVFVTTTNFCPLKRQPTDSSPAHYHDAKGKSYALVDALGGITLKCHVCPGEIVVSVNESESTTMDEIIADFNTRYGIFYDVVLKYPNQYCTDLVRFSFQSFKNAEAYRGKVKVGKKFVLKAQLWLEHPMARRYEAIVCDPSMKCSEKVYNTWQGFNPAVLALAETFVALSDDELMAKRKNVDKLLRTNICDNDETAYEYYRNWCALLVQRPEWKWGTCPVLSGPQGCGKGIVVSEPLTMVGKPHGIKVESKDLTDNYNFMLGDAVFVFADEAVAGESKEARNALKLLITEAQGVERRKYYDNVNRETFQHIIMASNDVKAAHIEPGERRYVPYMCGYHVFGENTDEHYALCLAAVEEVKSLQAPAAFYELCRRRDLSEFNPLAYPRGKSRFKMHFASFTHFERFVYNIIRTDMIVYHFDAGFLDNGTESPLRQRTLAIVAGNSTQTPIEQLGRNIWAEDREDDMYPKELMTQGFLHMFPNANREIGELWKYLYSLFPEKKTSWGISRVTGNRHGAFRMPTKLALKTAFMRTIGEHDDRIWGEWAQLE